MSTVVYEYPTNQTTRKFLRLEQLFHTIAQLIEVQSPATYKAALFRLSELIDFFDRNDIKTDLIKELERQHQLLSRLADSPAVDNAKLNYFTNQMEKLSTSLVQMGRPGDLLRHDPLLAAVRQKWSLGGACCPVDSPLLYHFLAQPPEVIQSRLDEWLRKTRCLRTSVNVILKLYRESGEFKTVLTQQGRYQTEMDARVKLVIVRIPATVPFIPEVSVGTHRMTLNLNPVGNASVCDTEVQLQIAKCRA